MKLILSPTKTMAQSVPGMEDATGIPVFEQEACSLNRQLARMNHRDIQGLFKTSEALTLKILDQIRNFETARPVPALFAFRGEAFKTLDPLTFAPRDLAFAQAHLRIFSGLYGILAPLDGIRPYRLDAATPLKQGTQSLKSMWKERLGPWFTDFLAPAEPLLNLASEEYAGLLKGAGLEDRTITLQFRELVREKARDKEGKQLKNIPVRAKQARGLFARAVITQGIQDPSRVKTLCPEGYVYSHALSTSQNWFFVRG